MRPVGKWLPQIRAQTPVQEATRLALEDRLTPIPRMLKRAGSGLGTKSSIRRVHQLRVATRRAGAAVQVFEDVLGKKQCRRWRGQLRRIRREAGAIREMDVLAARLGTDLERMRGAEAAAAKRLIETAKQRRAEAAKDLSRVIARLPEDRLERRRAKIVASIDATAVAESAVSSFARRVLRRELDDVRAGSDADLNQIERVHELRIAIKRLRYGMEIFGHCFDEPFRGALYRDLMSLQDRLGELNDLAGMIEFIRSAPSDRPAKELKQAPRGKRRAVPAVSGLERLAERYRKLLAREHAAFLEQWTSLDPRGFLERFESAIRPQYPVSSLVEPKAPGRGGRVREQVSRGQPFLNGHAKPRNQRLAAIDVGTNSLRLIIAEATPDGSYRVLDDEREVTRLGRGMQETGRLNSEAIEHSVAAIARMQSIAEGYGASRVRVVGTAAAREAANADELARAIQERTGLTLEIISAEQEAMLAFRSAARAFDLSSVAAAVVDIGGGSTEVVLSIGREAAPARVQASIAAAGDGEPAESHHALENGQANGKGAPVPGSRAGAMVERLYTIPLGAVRLTERFGGAEAASGERYGEMRAFVKRVVKQHIGRVPASPQTLVGTGGTFTALGAMAVQRELGPQETGLFSGVVQGHEVPRAEVRHILEYLRKLPVKERARVPGLSADRADIIVAGLVIVDAVLKRLGVDRARVHDGGIRDGLLLSMFGASPPDERAPASTDPIGAVRRFARACAFEEAHSLHVAALALAIFDQLGPELARAMGDRGFDAARARQILEAAAVLHDVGYLINYASHHKHSYHLIVHADLPGWTSREVQVIANIARYHRCASPKRKHATFAVLARSDQQLVRVLAAVLRIADGLDRTHIQRVRSVGVQVRSGAAFFAVSADGAPDVDLWGAARKSRLFERIFGLAAHFEWKSGERTHRIEGDGASKSSLPIEIRVGGGVLSMPRRATAP